MRVIAGKYRGRRLKGPEGLEMRPTGDRLKESLFSILAPDLRDALMLDAFGGTGAIGIEALSRGARQVVFIETTAAGCRLIRKNLELCGIAGGTRIIQEDVFGALRALGRKGFQADIVFFDPPYDFEPYKDLLDIVFSRSLLNPSAPSGVARVVIEHRRTTALPEEGNGYKRVRLVRQGDQCLSFYENQEGKM
ncbi:MAG: 16S rRNA (guanine(966)-N(2))-methyltransferase RsmD [Acidobacteriota bacterium]|jgi:16S rRNA (guanine(966)-N(2))-methyltransferase RsmD|nr:16S rRNA (guanine(966)-N(2))-methyltransferase RsmD [Acidobacteriota bacterium]